MGAEGSKPTYDPSLDPCSTHLDLYLACVDSKKDGLREGEECGEESEAYKLCRSQQKVRASKDIASKKS
jgi:hypothetical protein